MTSTISIAMAVFNGERFLADQLDSIARQTRRPDEMVIADDGSRDGTLAIVRDFQSKAPFPVTILAGETNVGYSRNFMRAADRCRGDLLFFADQDDVWHRDKIDLIAAVDAARGAAVVSHDLALASDPAGPAVHGSYYDLLRTRRFPPAVCFKGCSLAVRRDALERWGWPPASSTITHDFWVAVLATASGSRAFVPCPLVRHRLHDANTSGWIVSEDDLAYTPVELLGSRSDLEVMIELCIKSWRVDWTDALLQAADRLGDADRILTLRTALIANAARQGPKVSDPVPSAPLDERESRCGGGRPLSFTLTNEDYIARLYEAVLRRDVDSVGAAGCLKVLQDTGDPTLLLRILMDSEEYQNIIQPQRHRSQSETGGAASIRFGDITGLARSQLRAALPVGLDFVVPVFNSAEWLHALCDAYQAFGIEPLYIVDAACSDDSLAILRRRGERVFTVHNEQGFAEPLMSLVIPFLGSEWILRLDDDELPTRATLRWIAGHLGDVGDRIVGLPRRWVRETDGGIESCLAADGSWDLDRQYRLFRPAKVRANALLHTPGFAVDASLDAPPDAGILHLDWLVRDEAARTRKILAYETHRASLGWLFKSRYLPEQMPAGFYESQPVEDDVVLTACRRLVDSMGATPRSGEQAAPDPSG